MSDSRRSKIGAQDAVPEGFVDLGLSVYWATGNVCKTNGGDYYIGTPTEYGTYFSWGNIVGSSAKNMFTETTYANTPGASLTDNISRTDIEHDAVLGTIGVGRLPTMAEYGELYENCTYTKTSNYNNSGISGWVFVSNINGNEIFFPLSGQNSGTTQYSQGSTISNVGYSARYWQSTYYYPSSQYGSVMSLDTYSVYWNNASSRYIGYSVRGVIDKPKEPVDLGLPSGTLWAKTNIGAALETQYGQYYSYGKGATVRRNSSTEYTTYSGTENPLANNADSASQSWGENWHIPTKTQWEELLANTTQTWYTNFNGSGINGCKLASNADATKYIFFPACSYYQNSTETGVYQYAKDKMGYYMASTPSGNQYHYCFIFRQSGSSSYTLSRGTAMSVRPVIG